MTYTENAHQIPGVETEVLVIGAGPAGVAAAYTAAHLGAKTVIVEALGALGGIATSGMMSHWTGSCGSRLYHKILADSASLRDGALHGKIMSEIDPERLKYQFLKMLSDEGVKIYLYTLASEVIMEGNRVKGVIIENKEGRTAVLAHTVIDCSGDGDIAAKAGVPYFMGREGDGKMQPATLMFKVGGVDMERAVLLPSFESTYMTEKGELQALARAHLPAPAGHVLLYRSTLPGIVTCNMTNVTGIDGTKNADLVKAELVCRGQIDTIVNVLREYVPGFESCYLIATASLMGIRETRHFEGRSAVTEEDILTARVFDDWVVKGAHFNFDVHNLSGAGLDKSGCQHEFRQDKGYTIPYGCMLPKGFDGLLLSGRNISGTHMAHSNFRAMPICLAIGEADGIAAALAVMSGRSVREIRAEEIPPGG